MSNNQYNILLLEDLLKMRNFPTVDKFIDLKYHGIKSIKDIYNGLEPEYYLGNNDIDNNSIYKTLDLLIQTLINSKKKVEKLNKIYEYLEKKKKI